MSAPPHQHSEVPRGNVDSEEENDGRWNDFYHQIFSFQLSALPRLAPPLILIIILLFCSFLRKQSIASIPMPSRMTPMQPMRNLVLVSRIHDLNRRITQESRLFPLA